MSCKEADTEEIFGAAKMQDALHCTIFYLNDLNPRRRKRARTQSNSDKILKL